MKKLVVVYNPRSAQHELIRKEVINATRELQGWMIAKFEVKKLGLEENARRLEQILDDGDLVIVAGGDGTAAMVLNGIAMSRKQVTLGVLGYGHFNDFARTLGVTHPVEYGDEYIGGVSEIIKKLEADEVEDFYPLRVTVDQKLWRYVACYMSIGMAAEATKIFDQKEVRQKISRTSHLKSYLRLAKWYYKNRKKREFVPRVKVNGEELERATDIIVMNAPHMAQVMRGKRWHRQKETFAAGGFWLKKSWTLFWFMMKSMFKKVPVTEMKKLKIEFDEPADVMIQAEGEYEMLERAKEIEVEKGAGIKVIEGNRNE